MAFTMRKLHDNIVLWAIIGSSVSIVTSRIHNDPFYPSEYIGEDCVPYTGKTPAEARAWNERVWNMSDPESTLYGYIHVKKNDAPYDNPCNCAIKLLAPPGYQMLLRIPMIDIHYDDRCQIDRLSIIGNTNTLDYCGYGTVTHSIYSTTEWLIIRLEATSSDANHEYMGFDLYFTALHQAPCNKNSNMTYEFECNNHCIPDEVTCDDRDNCGDWDDERSGVCGLTEGAVIAISIVCVLVGGTLIFFLIFCVYNKQKENRLRARRQGSVSPTMHAGNLPPGGRADHDFASATGAEPPPPYTPEAYTNMGVYTGDEQNNTAVQQGNGFADNQGDLGSFGDHGFNVRVTRTTNLRPAIGEPPPVYTVNRENLNPNLHGVTLGATGDGDLGAGGVSFEKLPEKEDTC